MIRKSFKAVKILVFDFYNCDGQGIYSLWLPEIAKTILRKQNRAGDFTVPGFRPNYKAIVIKIAWYGIKVDTKINGIGWTVQK